MTRHPVDHQAPSQGGRTEHFAEIERKGKEGDHPCAKALHRRPVDRAQADRRVGAYTRIERGQVN